jgi:hypothetical protein
LPILAGRKIIAMKICGSEYILIVYDKLIEKSNAHIMKGTTL